MKTNFTSKTPFLLAAFLPIVILNAGCSRDMADLDVYMQEVRQKPAPPIEPVPAFAQFDIFLYNAGAKRSPFEKPQAMDLMDPTLGTVNPMVKPDELRPKEALEDYNISQIVMVGTVSKDGALWGLVDDGTDAHNIHRVQVGNYMGRNHGKIIFIDNSRMDLKEIVPNGPDGWLERPKTLQLQESAEQ